MRAILCFITVCLVVISNLAAQVKLPALISDGMVLQRDAAIKIWGWAAKGEKLTLGFNNKTYDAVADADGKWMITLPKMKAGGPYKMDIRASNEIHLSNICLEMCGYVRGSPTWC
jgi:sialate O-acetylesterase